MTETKIRDDWVHFFKASQKSYKHNALIAVLENDGEKMLAQVLKVLKLEKTQDFIREIK